MYFRICPDCGAKLDPGEHCDCLEQKYNKEKEMSDMFTTGADGQMIFNVSRLRKRQYANYIEEEMLSGNII